MEGKTERVWKEGQREFGRKDRESLEGKTERVWKEGQREFGRKDRESLEGRTERVWKEGQREFGRKDRESLKGRTERVWKEGQREFGRQDRESLKGRTERVWKEGQRVARVCTDLSTPQNRPQILVLTLFHLVWVESGLAQRSQPSSWETSYCEHHFQRLCLHKRKHTTTSRRESENPTSHNYPSHSIEALYRKWTHRLMGIMHSVMALRPHNNANARRKTMFGFQSEQLKVLRKEKGQLFRGHV